MRGQEQLASLSVGEQDRRVLGGRDVVPGTPGQAGADPRAEGPGDLPFVREKGVASAYG